MKIILYLMNEKGKKTLEAVIEKYSNRLILHVVGSKDKSVKDDYYNDIQELCIKNHIKFFDRKNISENYQKKKNIYKIVVGWRWIIDDSHNLIILHDSLLPKYRGFAPLVNALINKEKKVGVTAIFADKKFDCGDILSQKEIKINYPITIQKVIEKISILYVQIVLELLELIENNTLIVKSQNEKKATYSIWRDSNDYCINWDQKSSKIERFINAVGYPYLGASSVMENKLVRVLKVSQYPDVKLEIRDIGKVLFIDRGHPIVVCKKGLLKIEELIDNDGNDLLPLKKFRVRFQ